MADSTLDENPMIRYVPTELELVELCEKYQIGQFVNVQGELGGLFNVNLKVATTSGEYVFRIHSGLSRKDHMGAQQLLLHRLQERNVPVLSPMTTAEGENFLTLRHRFVQLTRFVSGIAFQYSEHQAFALGETLREFHDALKEENLEVPTPFWSNYPSTDRLLEGIDKLREQQQRGLHDHERVQQVEELYLKVMERWTPLADECVTTIIHGDWHPWNMIFNDHGRVEYILDFDGLQRGERIHDIAYFIWAIRNVPDMTKIIRPFMCGYGAISPAEKELVSVAAARASLFFLCTASFTRNPTEELLQQMKQQRAYIEWILFGGGHQKIRE